jgi:hypothetical protein
VRIAPSTLREAGPAFFDALQLGGEARGLVDYEINQCAELLPEPDAWAALGRGEMATLVLLSGDVLLTISREAAAQEVGELVVTWHPVRVTEITYRRDDQRTSWDFRFHDRNPLHVEGRMDYPSAPGAAETLDQAEVFARALAASIGWPIPEPESFRDEEPHDDELPDAASSRRRHSSRQPVTDLWGNPKPKRRSR